MHFQKQGHNCNNDERHYSGLYFEIQQVKFHKNLLKKIKNIHLQIYSYMMMEMFMKWKHILQIYFPFRFYINIQLVLDYHIYYEIYQLHYHLLFLYIIILYFYIQSIHIIFLNILLLFLLHLILNYQHHIFCFYFFNFRPITSSFFINCTNSYFIISIFF